MNLEPGQIITAPFLPASAEVKKLAPRRGYYRLEMLLKDGSNQYLSKNITTGQLTQIQIVERNPVSLTDNTEDFFFLIEARRQALVAERQAMLARLQSRPGPAKRNGWLDWMICHRGRLMC